MKGRRPAGRRPATWALIAGGGTGGHVIPAIAVGRALVARGHPASTIGFVGSARGLERRLVPEAGFDVTLLPGRGITRRVSWANVVALAGLAVAAVRAQALVGTRRPSVVVSVGGYASVACVLAAVAWRVPLVVVEQNAVPGLANRLAGRFAAACAVPYPGTLLPRAVVTGNPVRPEIAALDRSVEGRAGARQALGLPADGVVVVVVGGSLGASRINRAVLGLVRAWSNRSGVAVRHVVGARDWAKVGGAPGSRGPGASGPVAGGLVYQQVRFEDRMDLMMAAADVAVSRAGATTVSELAAAGLPAVLVPLPGAPGDHQRLNARQLEQAGAAVVVPDGELDAARLAAELDRLIGDPQRLDAMASAARTLARPGAADAVAALVEALAEAHARG